MKEDLLSLEQGTLWSRLDFVVTTLATGFALAVQHISSIQMAEWPWIEHGLRCVLQVTA